MEWVSIKDRLPEEKDFPITIIFFRNGERFLGTTDYIRGGRFSDEVTHWISLPKLPVNKGE